MLGASSDPSSIRALQIPELALMIFKLVDKRHAARLGRTSRKLFSSFMPLAWRNVSGATQIFSLILGTHIFRRFKEDIIVSALVI